MSEEELKNYIRKRGSIKAQLTLFTKFLQEFDAKTATDEVINNLANRLDKIAPLYDIFNEIQAEIVTLENDDEKNENELATFQDQFFAVTAKAQTVLTKFSIVDHKSEVRSRNQTESEVSVKSIQGRQAVKLPKLELPIFTGSFTQWKEFEDAFVSLIHTNSDLSETEKFCYLKSSLKGEPAEMLRSLKTTELNYRIAWESLNKRYDNTRRIVDTHVKEIVNLHKISNQSRDYHVHLRNFINTVRNQTKCLEALGQAVAGWNALLIPILLSKLDDHLVTDWESKLNSKTDNSEIPSLETFIEFLDKKQATLEATANLKKPEFKGRLEKPRWNTQSLVAPNVVCTNCNGKHFIQYCQTLLNLNPNDRAERVRNLKICSNCLRKGHSLSECKSSSCRTCSKRHNTILHVETGEVQKVKQNQEGTSALTSSINKSPCAQALLPTAVVNVYDAQGNVHTLRILLDSASQSNFITSETVKRLGLKTQPASLTVSGISNRVANITQMTSLIINSKFNSFKANVECFILDSITGELPSTKIDASYLDIPPKLRVSDSKFAEPGEIHMLIGIELFWQILCIGQIRNEMGTVFQKTKFGWVISGLVRGGSAVNVTANVTHTFLTLDMLDRNLERFWKVDGINERKNLLSAEERYCESYFTQTTTRADDGKFKVRIPMKPNIQSLGDSQDVAESRFRALERRFSRDDSFKKQYSDCIKDYQTQGHMSQVQSQDSQRFFLPHHAVIKESSETTKLRVVFDGSCQLNSGLPVNQVQCVGPTIQEDIFDIISRFRTHKYVFTADITQMYRQIWVSPEDRKFQTILWRNHPDEPMGTFELNTVTFGMGASPFLAIRCLFEIANLNEADYPEEAAIIKRDFYVDDCLTGSSSIDNLKTKKENLSNILGQAGFVLRKWRSNVAEINELNVHQDPLSLFDSDSLDLIKTLGIFWKPETDTFVYRVNLRGCNNSITKRTILSMTAQLFDPIGFLSPVIIVAKLIIQELWQLQLHWDEAIPSDISYCWLKFRDELKHVNGLAIPRFLLTSEYQTIEIHGFSDASEKAYGACVYVKSINSKGEIVVRLVAAKSRVAPLKVLSLPRLELLAAVLLSELVNKIKLALHLKFTGEFYWCDSQIVLGWLGAPPGKWATFVANRVAIIQELTEQGKWCHVRTHENPADVISRGASPRQLIQHDLWWHGPGFLRECQEVDGIIDTAETAKDIILPEAKKSSKVLVSLAITSFPTENFSNLSKLKRIAALCLRFARNCQLPKTQRAAGPISVQEQNEALLKLIKIVQIKSFSKEYESLKKKGPITPTSAILSLAPFLDANGLMRVGGRLKKSRFEFDKKHPIVLPKGEHIAKLIFEEKHIETCHGGPTMILNVVRERFWPISGKNLAKGVVRSCVKCCRFNAKVSNPLMGDLPENRVTPTPPFYVVGVDYAGPFLIKDKPGRGSKVTKCYISLFICFVTKAVHLELVTSLSAEAFMAAFRRFVARRGKPLHVYSDNGGNFVKTNSEIKKLYDFLRENADSLTRSVGDHGVNWHFIPAVSPHFGGLWEAGVKSVKYHLKRIMSNASLTFEEFYTSLVQIESILNSRPLTPMSNDPNDLQVLTPAHFLIGRSYVTLPDPDVTEVKQNRLQRYQYIQQLNQHFWIRWAKEYVSHLQQRQKWKQNCANITVGTMVLVKEDNTPPCKWKMGRVVECRPGTDGVVRVVKVKCANGILERAVAKVCALPVENNRDDE